MKIAFLTEMSFSGKIPSNLPNARTEFAWMNALDAEHFNIMNYPNVSGFDFVFIIWPKGKTELNAEGVSIANNLPKKLFNVLCESGEIIKIIPALKSKNGKICYIQEGPVWFPENYSLPEQIYHQHILAQSDVIFCHNDSDRRYYTIYNAPVTPIRSLILEDNVKEIVPNPERKFIVGGNFCRWYGGMNSYKVGRYLVEKGYQAWAPTMHNKQPGEKDLVKHLPYLNWTDWMKELSSFKIGIHMMPTVAAGTFSLNCAYFGIPVIGNNLVDTQKLCHPNTSVDVEDLYTATTKCMLLHKDESFWEECSQIAYKMCRELFIKEPWLKNMTGFLETIK